MKKLNDLCKIIHFGHPEDKKMCVLHEKPKDELWAYSIKRQQKKQSKALTLFKMGGPKRPPATSFSPVTEELSPKLFDC